MSLWPIAVVALLILALVVIARMLGKAKARADYFEESHEASVKAREIDESVARATDDTLNRELRGDK